MEDGEAAHAGVEHADRARVHRGDYTERVRIAVGVGYPSPPWSRVPRAGGARRSRSSPRCSRPGTPVGRRRSRTSSIASTTGRRSRRRCTFPDGAPPAGGWPAVVLLHGLGGNRQHDERARRGDGFVGERLRRPRLRRARPRRVGRPDRDRRPARDRRRRRRVLRLARATGRTSPTRGSAAGASPTAAARSGTRSRPGCRGRRSRSSRPGPTSARRSSRRGSSKSGVIAGFSARSRPERVDPDGARDPRRAVRRRHRGRAAVRGRALVAPGAEGREDAGAS